MHLIIPTGTKVVSRHDRRVGFVVHAPASLDGLYRSRRTKSTVVRANGRGFGGSTGGRVIPALFWQLRLQSVRR
jgi:hypothetical protein